MGMMNKGATFVATLMLTIQPCSAGSAGELTLHQSERGEEARPGSLVETLHLIQHDDPFHLPKAQLARRWLDSAAMSDSTGKQNTFRRWVLPTCATIVAAGALYTIYTSRGR